jgi:hypothetical protein
VPGRYIKGGVLVFALVILVVEGFFVYRWYERYYGSTTGAASDGGASQAVSRNVPVPEGAAKNGDAPSDAALVHMATDANSQGDYTYLDDPRIDGNPDAVVLAQPSPGRGDDGAAYGRNIGVWYEPGEKKWAIFNQDLAPVPSGSAFGVVVPPADRGFVHRAVPPNTVGNATYIDDPLLDGEPRAEVSVTQNWNPGGGGGGVYNDHPVGVLYDEDVDGWFVYNEDGAPIPEGAAFNVAVLGTTEPAS